MRNLKAEFVKPAKPASGEIEQFINLESAAVGQDCKGHTVTVVVAMEGDAARAPAARKGREGDPVYLQATFSRGSKRSSPAPDLLDVTGRTEDDAGKVVKAKVALGPSGEAATFRLELGQAGGDTCELKIGATPACNDATLKFINWRKLYYQVTRPDTLACPDMASITAGLAKVFVRYERYKDLTFAEADVPAAPGGSWFDGPMVGGGLAGRCVNIGASNRDFFHAKFEDTKNPIGVHVLVCHSQFDASAAEVDHFTSPDIAAATTKVAFPGGGAVHGWELDADPDGSKGYNVFSKAMHDGGEGARGVKWKSLATSGDQKDKSGDITAADVSIDYPTATSKVTVRLPAPAVAVLDAGEKVRVEMDVHYALGPYNGEAAANLQLIRSREAVGMNGTMTHELGHTMQQVLYAVPPGLAAADHGWKYDKRGHTGNHCAFGLPKALYDGGGKLTGREDCKCVMYGEGATNRPVEFCEKCAPFVTAEALTSLV
ncbi:MAG: hypothetical protein IPF99_20875 [Deltaproteobacteria bacterium]|nr:hypothetical protein [Deltaproteobacteria bacterium]